MIAKAKLASVVISIAFVLAFFFPKARADHADDSVVTVSVANAGQPIVARCDAQGVVHVLCDSSDGPQYVRSADNGKTFSQPIAVVDRASRKPGLVFTAWDMAIGQEGRMHVAMSTNAWKLKLPQEEWAFHYARLDPGASAFTPTLNVNRKPSEGFSLAADDRGNVTACWLSSKLYANVSHDNGATFGPAVEIDPKFDPCDCCTTSSVYAEDGRLAVLYREETNDDRDMFLVLWDQGRNQTVRTRISTTLWKIAACPMSYYTVTSNREGFVAVWPTEGQVYFARLDGQGALLPPGEIKTAGATGMRTGMLTLTDAKGTTLVAWKKNGEMGWQLYDNQGQPAGHPGTAKSAGNGAAGVLCKDGRFVLFR